MVFQAAVEAAKKKSVKLLLLQIPREVMEQQAHLLASRILQNFGCRGDGRIQQLSRQAQVLERDQIEE